MKITTFAFYNWGLGRQQLLPPPPHTHTLKQPNKSPKTMGLLPSSLKIITSAPQLSENKYPFSPDPQNPWGPFICPYVSMHAYVHTCKQTGRHFFLFYIYLVRSRSYIEQQDNISIIPDRRERSGSVVECLTRDRRAAGSSLIGVTALCP